MEKFSIESIFLFLFFFGAAFPEREHARDDEENARITNTRKHVVDEGARQHGARGVDATRRQSAPGISYELYAF